MSSDSNTAPTGTANFETPPSMSVRAQLLSTEHWSLLATRSMTWSEVMSRISIHLTVASAALVVLALFAQTSGFGTAFDVLSIGLASAVLVLGTLTGMRVHNASVDDAALVLGMNRIRAAYVTIDPTLADYLLTAWNDDEAGLRRTYTMGFPRHMLSQILGSTNMFMTVVNSIVAGTLGALIGSAADASVPIVSVVGVASGVAYLGAMMFLASRSFSGPPVRPRFPTPQAGVAAS